MPFELHVDEERNHVTVHGRGNFEFQESSETMISVSRDPRYVPGMTLHLDLCDMEFVPTPDETWRLALVFRSLKKSLTGKIAISVSNPLHYGLARIVATYAGIGGIRIKPFMAAEEAYQWLDKGVDEDGQ